MMERRSLSVVPDASAPARGAAVSVRCGCCRVRCPGVTVRRLSAPPRRPPRRVRPRRAPRRPGAGRPAATGRPVRSWRRAIRRWRPGSARAAERIHQANQKKLFEGRPHHLLQAVIVVEATVDRSGNVVGVPCHAVAQDQDAGRHGARVAEGGFAACPHRRSSLLVRGNLVFSETWLVQNDGPLSGPHPGACRRSSENASFGTKFWP